MAESVVKVQCQITDIQDIPNSEAKIVSVHFTQGDRQWFKGFRVAYDRPISMEEFKRELLRVGIYPDDFLAYVRAEREEPFVLEVAPDNKDDISAATIEAAAHT